MNTSQSPNYRADEYTEITYEGKPLDAQRAIPRTTTGTNRPMAFTHSFDLRSTEFPRTITYEGKPLDAQRVIPRTPSAQLNASRPAFFPMSRAAGISGDGLSSKVARTPEYQVKQKYCNNCRKYGHPYHQCKMPITSYGLIVFRKKPATAGTITYEGNPSPVIPPTPTLRYGVLTNSVERSSNEFPPTPSSKLNALRPAFFTIEYLMIRRRDTLGFIDFIRGKYSVYDKSYILNMIVQMTVCEKTRLLTDSFGDIWRKLWGGEPSNINLQYRTEEQISRDKFAILRSGVLLKNDFYTLETLIESTMKETDNTISKWEVAEWGFPKGRRNYQEKDYDCAVREFCEETGYTQSAAALVPIQNIMPFEEIFTGSNYKSYKHKYYLTYMPYEESIRECAVQSSEVSCAEWKTYDDCLSSIRHYNVEKKRILENVNQTILRYL